ncbi:MAG: hypothetical protein JST06_08845 [Bacteroidetes bacterium]|nr:hypothetical protein [Bacteroidota bacterium]
MKRILYLLAFSVAIFSICFFPSCKKSDNSTPSRSAQIVGNWKAYQQGTDANGNGVWDADEHTDIVGISMSGITVKLGTITLKDDKSGTATATILGNPTTMPLTWSLLNNDNDLQVIVTTLAGPYTLSGTIISLNETELILRQSSTGAVSFMSFIKQ